MDMDVSDLQHLKELVRVRMVRLRALEKIAARDGRETPTLIIMEIDEIQEHISELNEKISRIEGGILPPQPPPPSISWRDWLSQKHPTPQEMIEQAAKLCHHLAKDGQPLAALDIMVEVNGDLRLEANAGRRHSRGATPENDLAALSALLYESLVGHQPANDHAKRAVDLSNIQGVPLSLARLVLRGIDGQHWPGIEQQDWADLLKETLSGRLLADRMAEGRWSVERALALAVAVGAALIEDQRHLPPAAELIRLDDDGSPTFIGRAAASADPQADVRALAALMIELVTEPRSATVTDLPEAATPALRYILQRALTDESAYTLSEFITRLHHVQERSCLCDIVASAYQMPQPLREVVGYAIQLCNGLIKDHNAQRRHQNLRPENVVLQTINGQKRAAWVDFEVCAESSANDVLEQHADVQAIGALLHLMLTGRRAPADPAAIDLAKLAPWATLGLDRILRKALAPAGRGYPDVTILGDRLEHHLHYLRPIQEIDRLLYAHYPLVYIVSWEEERVRQVLERLARIQQKSLYTWTVTDGLFDSTKRSIPLDSRYHPAEAVLDHIIKTKNEKTIFALFDLHPFMRVWRGDENAGVRRRLRDLAATIRHMQGKSGQDGRAIVLISPTVEIPSELEKEITIIHFPLPNAGEIAETLDETIDVIERSKGQVVLTPEHYEELVRSAVGLTHQQASRGIIKAGMTHFGDSGKLLLDHNAIDVVLHEKEHIIYKSGALEIFSTPDNFKVIGGLEELKAWFDKRKRAFTFDARDFGLPAPKGVLLVGVTGCGKSLAAKALASEWRKPLLRLDPSALFNATVGSSEENLRTALQIAESIAPSIMWIDEIEKVFSNIGAVNDGGVTARVFGNLITWLQEKTAPVFVVATANTIAPQGQQSGLPPELLRKGRFDEIFFVDLPNREERKQIFKVHISRRNRNTQDDNLEQFDLDALVDASENYNGAEIEQAVVDAMYDAFDHSNRLFHLFEKAFTHLEDMGEGSVKFAEDDLEQAMVALALERWKMLDPNNAPAVMEAPPEAMEYMRNVLEKTEESIASSNDFQKFINMISVDNQSTNENSTKLTTESPFELSTQAILRSLKNIHPLYTMRSVEIQNLRRWAAHNTRPASRSEENKAIESYGFVERGR